MSQPIGPELYPWVGLSTAAKPDKAYAGQRAIETDTMDIFQWFGDIESGSWVRIARDGTYLTRTQVPSVGIVNSYFSRDLAVADTLAVAAAKDDTTVELDDATGFIAGDDVHITNGTEEVTFPRITSIAAAPVLQLDRPLDNSYDIGDDIHTVATDLSSTAGAIGAAISYKVFPKAGIEWDLTRAIIAMIYPTAGDDGEFGNLTALTNGVLFRGQFNSIRTTFTNWKTNGDIRNDMFDVNYPEKPPAGKASLGGRITFSRLGINPTLIGDRGDFLEILIQDDITLLDSFQIKAQGVIRA